MCSIDKIEKYSEKVISLSESGYSNEYIAKNLGLSESEIRTIISFYYY